MQTSMFFILFSLFLFTISSATPVLDMAGKEVRAGVDYYILSVIRGGGGGGLTLGSIGNETCPLAVVQEQFDLLKGLPVYFRPVNPNEGVVHLSTDLNFVFNASTTCVQSTVWTLDFDESIQSLFVSTGGVVGNPGQGTVSNWFKIEEFGSGYKLVFCPGVCEITCRPVCGDVSILVQDNKRRLVVNLSGEERPFMVQFQRV